MRARLGSGLRRLKSRLRGRTDTAPGSHHVSLDASGQVRVKGDLGAKTLIDSVVMRSRVSGAEIVVPTQQSSTYDIVTVLEDLGQGGASTCDVYLSIRSNTETESRLVRVRAPHRARSVVLSDVVFIAGRPAWVYATQDGFVAIRSDDIKEPKISARIGSVSSHGSTLTINAKLTARNIDAGQAYVLVAVRSQDHTVTLPLEFQRTNQHPTKYQVVHEVTAVVDGRALLDQGLPVGESYLDVSVVVDRKDADDLRCSLMIPGNVKSFRKAQSLVTAVGQQTQVFVPYATFKGSNLAFAAELFDTDAYRYMRRLSRLGILWSIVRPFAGVWLVGETPYKAQDAGFRYFEWVRKNHPRRRVFYVLSPDSPEVERVRSLGNLLTIRSREHILNSFLASRIATTHVSDYVLPTSDKSMMRWMRGTRVFLQHGVVGTKNMVKNYGRTAHGFHTDFVHVSSAREREIFINDFDYRPRQIRVTGLSRFDSLLAPSDKEPAGLLVIPTWRDWLIDPEGFQQSKFFERWRGFLESQEIQEAIADGLLVTMILHPNMRTYSSYFDVEGISFVHQGEEDVQTLMRAHAALLTDYSSVGIDFALQKRPVFYYQFDREEFIGIRGSHLDLNNDLPGRIFRQERALTQAVVSSWRDGFPPDPFVDERIARLVEPARTGSYCQQVHDAINSSRSWRVPFWRLRDSARGRLTYRRFRSHKYYYRVMSAMSLVGRLLPRRNLIVFESNSGGSASDSPYAIYQELVDRGSKAAMVWSTTSTFRPSSMDTRKVKPGSPRYFWLLSRARYWVNNQNFGPLVRPPAKTTYLQTWHGTPLKRMQFDAVATAGRDEGYLERVKQKTLTWSLLLSPSPYATGAFRSAFQYEGPILEVGYPRNDVLVNHADVMGEQVRAKWGIPPEARVILYAPTFRDDLKDGARFAWSDAIDWPAVVAQLPSDVVVLVRMHPIVRGSFDVPEQFSDRIIDVSDHADTQTLLCASDVLVTDYSSVMFDFSILDRPIVLYCYDLDHYRTSLRGFYFDIEAEAPGPLTQDENEFLEALVQTLSDRAEDPCSEQRKRFREKFAVHDDGKATARVVDSVFESTGKRDL